jgi:hypothetical protein
VNVERANDRTAGVRAIRHAVGEPT